MILKALKFAGFILLFAFLIEYFGSKGVVGFIAFIILFALWRIYIAREQFMTNIRLIETQAFGKPLERDFWDKDKPSIKKIINCRKKNDK